METQTYINNARVVNKVLLGHNRFATTGKVTRKNAHPFNLDTLVGVHNGTLKNKYELVDGAKYDTDSEALYHNFEVKGVKDTIKMVDGAYALTWYDKLNDTLNFLRNKERSLYFTTTEDGKTVFWASEKWMLSVALSREEIKHKEIELIPENLHHSFALPKRMQVFEKAHAYEVKQEPKPVKVYPVHGGNNVPSHPTTGQISGPTTKIVTVPALPQKKKVEATMPSNSSKTIYDINGGQLAGKTVFLCANGLGTSQDGAPFVIFSSHEYPDCSFRSYTKTMDIAEKVYKQKNWEGVVSGIGLKVGGVFYKVAHSSLTKILPMDDVDIFKDDEKVDHNKHSISKLEFKNRYDKCAWCSSTVEYSERWRAISRSDCLCEGCALDPEVSKYIS